jgi:uncharacterized protein YegJ (DUF2314 family)
MKRAAWMVIAFACAVTLGCGKSDARDPVVSVPADDPQMNAAIRDARRTVATFIAAVKSPKSSQNGFSVKMRIDDGDAVEHFWLEHVSFDGSVFRGTIDSDAETVTNVRLGDPERVKPSEISDWMYIDHGVLLGGYTIRALRNRLSGPDRAEFDRSLPFKIE